MLILLLACAAAPDPCDAMCDAAMQRAGVCLSEQGLSWVNAGYDDEAAWLDACATWAWEMRVLEADAGEAGAVDDTCETRADLFSEGDCDDWSAVDWNEVPW